MEHLFSPADYPVELHTCNPSGLRLRDAPSRDYDDTRRFRYVKRSLRICGWPFIACLCVMNGDQFVGVDTPAQATSKTSPTLDLTSQQARSASC